MSSSWISKTTREVIVYRSISNNVYANLALEDWIFKNVDLKYRRILLLWRNRPCVVIGRHQNPWMESNMSRLKQQGVHVARRRSGGGTVYHDLGNLNCTLFTNRQDYNRMRNLQLACDSINKEWSLGLLPTQRGDIITSQGKKVSGSAAKLTKDVSYHHFTILINASKDNLRTLLQHDSNFHFSSNATPSVPSPTANLIELSNNNSISYDTVCDSIGTMFYQRHHLDHNKIYDIDPSSENIFSNISKLKNDLMSDDWIYNKSPPFVVMDKKINCSLTVSKGIITNSTDNTLSHLIGQPYLKYIQSTD